MAAATQHTFVITVHEANDLEDTQTFGTQDPYVSLTLGTKKFKTKVCNDGGKRGLWNETFAFNNISSNYITGTNGHVQLKISNKNVTDR